MLLKAEDNIGTFDVVVLEPSNVTGAVLLSSPSKCSVMQLQRWLQCRGLNRQGVKVDLVQRVRDCLDLNIPIDPNVDDGGPYKAKAARVVSLHILVTQDLDIPLDITSIPTHGWMTPFQARDVPEMFNYGSALYNLAESLRNVMCEEYDGTSNQMVKM